MSAPAVASRASPEEALLAGYPSAAGTGFDEMRAADGSIRPHWRAFLAGFAALGPEGRSAAADATKRLLRESGIAFNVYADVDDRAHAWRLDLLPLLLPPEEWAALEAGLIQRARLLDAVLDDLYGERRLLRDGTLPPALLFAGEEFIRPSAKPDGGGRRFLYTYAVDLARSAVDGSWRVLGDQTDSAIGNGYVLASRVALSQGLGGLFAISHTRRLAGYYMQLQESFAATAAREDGRIVVLSPGPTSPSYFSHAYLARYLGYTLAESGDLTVRDNQLCLKTLDGLQRVDLLLSKVPATLADPLFQITGGAGVPGLLQAAGNGRVVVANRLGSGVVQGRTLAAFTPALARTLLSEDLLLADHETFWLGDPAMRAAALARLDELVLTPATARNDPGEPATSVAPAGLDAAARAKLTRRLEREGHRWVAQPPLRLATTPSLDGDRLMPTPYALRVFVVAAPGTAAGWAVMPGGLVRLAGGPTATALPNGYGSKDLWITGSAPELQPASLWRGTIPTVHLRRTGRDLLSRTADNLYWLGRYAERAEGLMRLLRSVLARLIEDSRPEIEPAILSRLLDLPLRRGRSLPSVPGAAGATWSGLEERAAELMYGPRAHGLRESLDTLHRTATHVRDQISNDAWRMLAALHVDRRWRTRPRALLAPSALTLLDEGIRALNAFSGTEAENMTRNYAWRFLEMGRRLERGSHLVALTAELVQGSAVSAGQEGVLRLLLELGDSFMTYRSRYLFTPLLTPVLDLLLLDETNPRSVAYQLKELEGHTALLPSGGPYRTAEQRLILRLLTELRLVEIQDLAEPERAEDASGPLARLLASLSEGLPELSNVISRSYFAHAEPPVTTAARRRWEEPA